MLPRNSHDRALAKTAKGRELLEFIDGFFLEWAAWFAAMDARPSTDLAPSVTPGGANPSASFFYKWGNSGAPPPSPTLPSINNPFPICLRVFSTSIDFSEGEFVVRTDSNPGYDLEGVPWRRASTGAA